MLTSPRAHLSRAAALVAALAAGLAGPPARAAEVNPALVEPTLAPGGIWMVGTTPTPAALTVWGTLAASLAKDELVRRSVEGVASGPLRTRLITTLIAGLSLPDVLDVAIGVPLDVVASGDAGGEVALGDLRLEARARLLTPAADAGGFGLALGLEASLPTGGSAPFATEGGVTLTPRLTLAWHAPGGGAIGLNAGFRVRPGAVVHDLAIGDELRLGVGGELPLGHYGLSMLVELDGAVGFGDAGADRGGVDSRKLPLEALGGLRWRPSDTLALSAGVGAGLTEGYGAASWRALLALTIGAPASAVEAPAIAPAAAAAPPTSGAAGLGPGPSPAPTAGAPTAGAPTALPEAPAAPPAAASALAELADPDADADGIPLGVDACPDEPEDHDGFEDEDGCPDLDDDGDGIPDAVDACPREAEVFNGVDDSDGCPDEGAPTAPPVSSTGAALVVSGEVRFAPASAVLTDEGAAVVDGVAAFMRAHPEIWRVRVEGHTDSRGIPEQNVDLSERRAASVRRRLIRGGVAAERVATKGFGATAPITTNATAEGRAKNRRVEFHVLAKPADATPPPPEEAP